MAAEVTEGRAANGYLASAASLLPMLGFAAVTVAISYNIIFLFFADVLSIAPLTLADVLSKAWVIVPLALLYFAVQAAAVIGGYSLGLPYGDAPAPRANDFLSKVQVTHLIFGVLLVLAAPAAAAVARAAWTDDLDVYRAVVTCLFTQNLGFVLVLMGGRFSRRRLIRLPLAFYLLMMLIFAGAALGGVDAVTQNSLSLVRYGEKHAFCGRLVAVLERGVIVFEPTHRVRKLIPTSEIKSIETPVACKPAAHVKAAIAKPATSKAPLRSPVKAGQKERAG